MFHGWSSHASGNQRGGIAQFFCWLALFAFGKGSAGTCWIPSSQPRVGAHWACGSGKSAESRARAQSAHGEIATA
eukprot:316857-Pyramimonas_sp.AAC.1